jgi:hypothetical protein
MRRLAFLCVLLALPACSESEPTAVEAGGTAASMQPLYATLYSNLREPRRMLIRDAETWAAVWAEMASVGDPRIPPFVDFAKEDVLVAAMGERRSAGYHISIESISGDNESVTAVVASTTPGPTCDNSEIITAPLEAIRVSKVEGAVAFVERVKTLTCS